MPGRFDPVRDSTAISPSQVHATLDGRKYPPSSPFESQDEGETVRVRHPSRSASIADILNDEPVEPIRRSVSGELGEGSSHGMHESSGGYGRPVYYGSSPSSSNIGLHETSHRPQLLEMSYETGEGAESSSSFKSHALRRQSSSHSASSSSDLSFHQQYASQQIPHRSPSMLHLLHSEGPRSAPLPAQSEPRPRSRGPSFAGGFSILSPTTDGVPNGKHGGSMPLSHRREETQTSLVSSPHPLTIDSSRSSVSQANDQSYFAVPDVPIRSPEVMRNRKSLPPVSVSPLSTTQSLPPTFQSQGRDDDTREQPHRVPPHQSSMPDPKPVAAPKIQPTPPEPSRTPYKPTTRVSVPTTVRQPVTAEQVSEMRHQCQNSLRTKWQRNNPGQNDGFDRVVAKFAEQVKVSTSSQTSSQSSSTDLKRKREEEEDNARLVAHHYNSRQDQGLNVRKQSPILPLRNFNNWVKSVLIGSNAKAHGRVLDLGGGKGGDLNKWDKAGIDEYILCDIAAVSIEQAESRFKERRYHFNARFFAFDCFGTPLADNIPKALLDPLFDNVTLQFCLHYGWESVHKAQLMLENIARYLKPGGVFVGTIPNADLLRDRLSSAMQQQSSEQPETFFGNHCYRVAFDPTDEKNTKMPPFGHKYHFTLLDAVDDVAEYVVDWDQFISLARQNGLECIFKKTFEEMWREEGQMDRHRELARRMKIYSNGPEGIPMNEELWEATGLYLAFAFQKVDKKGRI